MWVLKSLKEKYWWTLFLAIDQIECDHTTYTHVRYKHTDTFTIIVTQTHTCDTDTYIHTHGYISYPYICIPWFTIRTYIMYTCPYIQCTRIHTFQLNMESFDYLPITISNTPLPYKKSHWDQRRVLTNFRIWEGPHTSVERGITSWKLHTKVALMLSLVSH